MYIYIYSQYTEEYITHHNLPYQYLPPGFILPLDLLGLPNCKDRANTPTALHTEKRPPTSNSIKENLFLMEEILLTS